MIFSISAALTRRRLRMSFSDNYSMRILISLRYAVFAATRRLTRATIACGAPQAPHYRPGLLLVTLMSVRLYIRQSMLPRFLFHFAATAARPRHMRTLLPASLSPLRAIARCSSACRRARCAHDIFTRRRHASQQQLLHADTHTKALHISAATCYMRYLPRYALLSRCLHT